MTARLSGRPGVSLQDLLRGGYALHSFWDHNVRYLVIFGGSRPRWPDLLHAFSTADLQPLAKEAGIFVVVFGRTQHFGVLTAYILYSLLLCVESEAREGLPPKQMQQQFQLG